MNRPNIRSCWLELNRSLDAFKFGSIPPLWEPRANKNYVRTLVSETQVSCAFMPLSEGRFYRGDGTRYIAADVGFNLYKQSYANAESDTVNTLMLLHATVEQPDLSYSTRLIYMTNQVALVDEGGIRLVNSASGNDDGFIASKDYRLFDEPMQLHADAMITNTPGVSLIAYAADCALVRIEDEKTGAVGVFHTAYKNATGLSENCTGGKSIIATTIEQMNKQFGSMPKDLTVTLFPAISSRTLTLGGPSKIWLEQLREQGFSDCINGEHLSLTKVVVKELIRHGVKKHNIALTSLTTDSSLLQSYRLARPAECKNPYFAAGREVRGCTISPDDFVEPDADDAPQMTRSNAANLLVVTKK